MYNYNDILFHKLPPLNESIPDSFTYPFCYTPHPLCKYATKIVQEEIKNNTQWHNELQKGKMFGVLIVKNKNGDIGFLAAFSGAINNQNIHPFFVPPIYDISLPDGYFKSEEANISNINSQIRDIESSSEYLDALNKYKEANTKLIEDINQLKEQYNRDKIKRELLRENKNITPDELKALAKESQFQKAEIKRVKTALQERLNSIKEVCNGYESKLEILYNQRKSRSAKLQEWLFSQFIILNAKKEERDLIDIFSTTAQGVPPGGAGECAAPKLLQYAYKKGYHPIAMAEFWWGDSPKGEIRHHGHFYPACKGKCEPILSHMLIGVNVEANPLINKKLDSKLDIIYEDQFIIVLEKPSGLLSAPGKSDEPSVYSIIRSKYPDATGPLLVHRLDMDTSGILIVAKTKNAHQYIQNQFINNAVKKKYIAILEEMPKTREGEIDLPLLPDILDRPRQKVDFERGKAAITKYKIVSEIELETNGELKKCAMVEFSPRTGRTHQLRVHASHHLGLNSPILGDRLYGKAISERLYLHAQEISFCHPNTGKKVTFKSINIFNN